MWQVKSEKEGVQDSEVYYVIVDEEVTVGRKNNEIIIKEDQSVSRKHAVLRTSHPISSLADLKTKPNFTVKDNFSKYGTFVNGKLIGDHGTLLKHGDLITFGQCGSNFRVSYTPMIVTTSCMEPNEKLALKETIRKLGGHVVDEWNAECTHLSMTKVKVTVKTVCALVSTRPIVSAEYFKMLLECCKNKEKPQEPEKYMPPVNEILISKNTSFHVNPNREHLFKDKTFIFLSVQQFKKLRLPIILASGKAVLMNRSRCDVTPELLISSCVIQCPEDKGCSQSQTCSTIEIENINTLLQKHKKRLIPESDIGLAVVHCSTEQYCNPNYEFDKTQSTSFTNEAFKLQSQTLSQNFEYVSETLFSTDSVADSINKSTVVRTEIQTSLKSNVDVINESDRMSKASGNETIDTSVSNLLKMEFPLNLNKSKEPNISNVPSSASVVVSMETETCQTGKNASSSMTADLSSVRIKRPAVNEEEEVRNSKREKLDPQIQSVCQDDIKIEPPSPPPQQADQDGNDCGSVSIFDADTQPASQTLFKEESGDTDIELKLNRPKGKITEVAETPTKRLLNRSDISTKKFKITLSSKTSVNIPSGYISSRDTTNTSKMIENKMDINEEVPLLCRSLRIVEIVDLVVKPKSFLHQYKENIDLGSPARNFKKFKKSSNLGANRIPLIIGGRDLIVHTCKESLSELNEFLQNQDIENTQPSIGMNVNTSFRANFKKQARLK